MTYSGWYASDGSMNVTVVPGTSYTGLHALDGSVNVVLSSGGTYVGAYHPCGAWWVTDNTSTVSSVRAADGSLNISASPYKTGTQHVTVVSGGISSGLYYYYLGF